MCPSAVQPTLRLALFQVQESLYMAEMISQKLKDTNSDFCNRLFAIAKPKYLKAYDCSMKCYRDSKASLETCDKCSQDCENDLPIIRKAQSQLSLSMVRSR